MTYDLVHAFCAPEPRASGHPGEAEIDFGNPLKNETPDANQCG